MTPRPLKPSMSQQEYLQHGGNKCPFCQSDKLDAELFDSETLLAWRQIQCMTCQNWWVDLYTLTGFETDATE
jgi:hypothetical protein